MHGARWLRARVLGFPRDIRPQFCHQTSPSTQHHRAERAALFSVWEGITNPGRFKAPVAGSSRAAPAKPREAGGNQAKGGETRPKGGGNEAKSSRPQHRARLLAASSHRRGESCGELKAKQLSTQGIASNKRPASTRHRSERWGRRLQIRAPTPENLGPGECLAGRLLLAASCCVPSGACGAAALPLADAPRRQPRM